MTRIWTGGGATDNWTNAANWSGGAPLPADILKFGATTHVTNFTSGMFQYPDNAIIGRFNGYDWRITYDANNGAAPSLNGGNDVAIYSVAVSEPATMGLLATALLCGLACAWRTSRNEG